MPDTVEIKKRRKGANPYADLAIGDPYTFLLDEPGLRDDGTPVEVGDTIQRVHNTADGGRYFEVVAIHQGGQVFETRYLGRFAEVFPNAPDQSGPYRRAVEEWRAGKKGDRL
jgi:hypothetical protein